MSFGRAGSPEAAALRVGITGSGSACAVIAVPGLTNVGTFPVVCGTGPVMAGHVLGERSSARGRQAEPAAAGTPDASRAVAWRR